MKYDIQSIINRNDAGELLEFVFFWGHHAKPNQVTKACFSQWFPCFFEADGTTYNCAEQYMMAEKARVFGDDETRYKILASSDPKVIKELGREVKNFTVDKWVAVSKDIVVKGNLHKFAQNPQLLQFLQDTGNKVLVEASPYDLIWGIGMRESDKSVNNPHNWKGQNLLGFALMEVRDVLLYEQTKNDDERKL